VRTIIHPGDWNTELARWRGGSARLWMYHPSHSRLALMLYRPEQPEADEALYVAGADCQRMKADFFWQPVDLRISSVETTEKAGLDCVVTDRVGGLELHCGAVVLIRGPLADFEFFARGFLDADS
jgi:hypothetical protein